MVDRLKPEGIQESIREFIRNNSKCSEGELIRGMIKQEVCSRDTVRKYVSLLKGSGDIIVERDKRRNNQTHHLVLNDKSQFNQIDQKIAEVQKKIDRMQIVDNRIRREDYVTINNEESAWWNLQFLLIQANMLPLESDSLTLFKKIIKVMISLTLKQIKAMRKQPVGVKTGLGQS